MDRTTKILLNQGIRYANKQRRKATRTKTPKQSIKKPPKPTTNVVQSKKRGRPFTRSQAEIEAIKQLREEYNKLKRRIENIQNKYGDVPAVETYYNKGLNEFSVKGKSLEDLNKLRLDVEYVSGLKTSYVKGAIHYQDYVAEWIDLYEKNPDTYKQIMTLYNRMVEENEIAEKFKYQIIEEIYTMIETEGHLSPEEMAYRVREKFEEMYLNTRISDLLGGSGYEVGGKVR